MLIIKREKFNFNVFFSHNRFLANRFLNTPPFMKC